VGIIIFKTPFWNPIIHLFPQIKTKIQLPNIKAHSKVITQNFKTSLLHHISILDKEAIHKVVMKKKHLISIIKLITTLMTRETKKKLNYQVQFIKAKIIYSSFNKSNKTV